MAQEKKEVTNGNIDALPILRGRHQPGGLGSHRGVLCPLRGNHRRNLQPGVGRIGVFAASVGTGAGLETGHESCVVRWGWWQLLSVPALRGYVWDALGRCLSYPFSRPFQLHFGGRWPGWRKAQNRVTRSLFTRLRDGTCSSVGKRTASSKPKELHSERDAGIGQMHRILDHNI